MSQFQISSAIESPMVQSLESVMMTDPYSYGLKANYPNSGFDILTVPSDRAISGSPHGQEVSFSIPRSGGHFLVDAILKVEFTTGGAETVLDNTKFGSRFFESISFRTHSHQIVYDCPDSIIARLGDLDTGRSLSYADMIECATTGGAATRTIYIRPSNSFIDNLNQALPTRFVEACQLVCRVNTQTKMGLTAAISAATITLLCKYRTLQSEHFEAYLNNNMNSNKLNNQLIYSWYQETPITCGTLDTVVVCPIKCPHVVQSTYFYISDFSGDTILAQTAGNGIKDVSFKFAGKSVFENLTVEALQAFNSRYDGANNLGIMNVGTNSFAVANNTRSSAYTTNRSGVFAIHWGEVPKDYSFNSHSAAFGNINNPELSITLDSALGTSAAKLHVVHRYLLFSSLNPQDGTLNCLSSL